MDAKSTSYNRYFAELPFLIGNSVYSAFFTIEILKLPFPLCKSVFILNSYLQAFLKLLATPTPFAMIKTQLFFPFYPI